jgi:CheY-like chemotaxis protein
MRETAPDLILCDVLMPFMDGRALFREVKDTPALREVPFVFLSGWRATPRSWTPSSGARTIS